MKNNSRTHGNKGRVGYRTPSSFRFQTLRLGAKFRAANFSRKYGKEK